MATVTQNTVDANLIEVKGYGVTISYSKSSITGDPRFTYTDENGSLNFSGEDIRVEASEIGELVTTTIETVADLHTITATLLVPTVNLPSLGSQVDFSTVVIVTTHRTTIAGPELVDGQLKTYKCLEVKGTAKNVAF